MTAIIPVMGPVIGATTFSPAASPFGAGIDADALLWRDAVVANGGTVSANRLVVVSAFVAAEKASGAWALTDDYWGLWGENAPQALTSLKQRRLATAVNTPTFTADRDYTLNGSTQYIDTGFIPSTHGINYTGGDQRLAFYDRANASTTGQSAGASDGSGNTLAKITINSRTSGNMTGLLNTAAALPATFALGVADSRGLKVVSRAGGGTTALGYDRGVRLADVTGMSVNANITSRAIYIGCYNNAGVAAGFRSASAGFVAIGGPLSDAQELAQYNAVQAWATAVGAQV